MIGARTGQAIAIDFESENTPWRDTGVNIMVMRPGAEERVDAAIR